LLPSKTRPFFGREKRKGAGPKSAIYFRHQVAKLKGYAIALITIKVLDARRRGTTTEAYGAIRRKEERSKATPLARSRLGGEMMP
jgi:hypothetical protein